MHYIIEITFIVLTLILFIMNGIKYLRPQKTVGAAEADIPNVVSWLLWSLILLILTTQLIIADGNYVPKLVYLSGNLIIIVCALIGYGRKTLRFGRGEVIATICMLAAIVVWLLTTNEIAIIASVTAATVGGLPLIKDAWLHPHKHPFKVYCGYVAINILACCMGRPGEGFIKEFLQPVVATTHWIIVLLLTARQFSKKHIVVA